MEVYDSICPICDDEVSVVCRDCDSCEDCCECEDEDDDE